MVSGEIEFLMQSVIKGRRLTTARTPRARGKMIGGGRAKDYRGKTCYTITGEEKEMWIC